MKSLYPIKAKKAVQKDIFISVSLQRLCFNVLHEIMMHCFLKNAHKKKIKFVLLAKHYVTPSSHPFYFSEF